MSYILGILDTDLDYANQLMDYIKRKQKAITQIRIFTNLNSLKDYLVHDKINVLLLHEDIPAEEVVHQNVKNICILSEGNYTREQERYPVIYKFQSAQRVMEELFAYFPLEDILIKTLLSSNKLVSIVSVFSIGKESERQVFSYLLAKEYAKTKRTLYISLDLFPTLTDLSGRSSEKGLSDFIYYLKQSNPNLSSKMHDIISKSNGMDCIYGVSFGPDIYELVPEDIYYWLKTLKESAEYDVVVYDVGCYFQSTIELFRGCEKLFLLIGEQTLEQVKYQNFRHQLQIAGYEDILNLITEVPLSRDMEYQLGNFSAIEMNFEEYSHLVKEYVMDASG